MTGPSCGRAIAECRPGSGRPPPPVAAVTGVYAVDKDVPHNRLSTQIHRLRPLGEQAWQKRLTLLVLMPIGPEMSCELEADG